MEGSLKARARAIIERRKTEKRDALEARRAEIFARFPRVEEIERKLDSTGLNLINCVLDGSCTPDEAVRRIMAENREANAEKRRILSENGFDPDCLDDLPICKIWGDSGYCDGELCSCVAVELNRELLREANLSERLTSQTFDSFRFDVYSSLPDKKLGFSPRENIESVYSLCRSFADKFGEGGPNLLFTGGSGLGKTYLSSAIANELIKKGYDVLYISANSLFPILEDLHFNRSVSEQNRYLVDHVPDCDLLILDDLGAEFITAFTSAELFRILNERLMSGKRMVISTNLAVGELKDRYSERVYSRIVGGFEIVAFFGEDIRIKMKLEQ